MPKLPTVPGELAGAIRRGKAEGRVGPEHGLDVARARHLAALVVDPKTPRSAVAAIDRRLDVILARLGFVTSATGPTELEEWLAGLADESAGGEVEVEGETGEDASAPALPPEADGPD